MMDKGDRDKHMDKGEDLLRLVIQLSGLPEDIITADLVLTAERYGIILDHITTDELRELIALYVQDTLILAKDSQKPQQEKHDDPSDGGKIIYLHQLQELH